MTHRNQLQDFGIYKYPLYFPVGLFIGLGINEQPLYFLLGLFLDSKVLVTGSSEKIFFLSFLENRTWHFVQMRQLECNVTQLQIGCLFSTNKN